MGSNWKQSPLGGGSKSNVILMGMLLVFGVVGGFWVLNTGGSFLGFGNVASSVLAGEGGVLPGAGSTTVDTTGALGIPTFPYSTVTMAATFKDGRGTNHAGTYYVWDAQPQYWGNENLIDNDYSKGTPLTGTLSSGAISQALNTVQPTKADPKNAGHYLVENKDYFVTVAITGVPDPFLIVPVPNAGGFDSTSPTLQLGSFVQSNYDTTDWASAALDMAYNDTNSGTDVFVERTLNTTYTVGDYNTVNVYKVKLDGVNKLGDNLNRLEMKLDGGNWTTIWDDAAGIDLTTYDGNQMDYTWVDNTDGILASYGPKDVITLSFRANLQTAASTVVANDGFFSDGEFIVDTVTITDPEGSTLLAQSLKR